MFRYRLADMSDSQAEAGGSGSAVPPSEDSVTMLDVLQEEEELDEDAAAVLGNTDDKQCSYDQVRLRLAELNTISICWLLIPDLNSFFMDCRGFP